MNILHLIPLIALGVSLILLVIYARAGYFSAHALDHAPRRTIGLCPCRRRVLVELVMTILFTVAASVVAQAILHGVFGPMDKTTPIDHRLIVQIVLQIVSELPLALFVYIQAGKRRRGGGGGLRRIGLIPRRPVHDLGVAAAGLITALAFVFGIITIVTIIGQLFHLPAPELGHPLLREMANHATAIPIALSMIMAVIIAPILEESIFRGLIQSSLVEWFGPRRRWWAVAVTAALFMAAHLGSGVAWQALPGLFVLGLILGWVYERTGDLWTNITIHAGFNLFNIAITLVGIH